jgi:RNA polymerase sigma-70 factor, ECF subfamily
MDIHTSPNQHLVQLLHRVSLRDDAAFRQLYDLTSSHLYGIALRFVRRHETADEILQEAFINVWQQAGTYAATLSAPMTWLISIVRNKALDSLRRAKVEGQGAAVADDDGAQVDADGDHGDVHADPQALFAAAIDKLRLDRCLSDLDPPQRQSLALVYYTGLSHSELSAHLQVPLGTAKAWVRRGLERLRLCLERTQDRPMSEGAP